MEISKETLIKYIGMAISDCTRRVTDKRYKNKEGFSITYKYDKKDGIAKIRANGSEVLMLHFENDFKEGGGVYKVTFESHVGYDKTVDGLSEIEEIIDDELGKHNLTWSEMYKVKVFTKDDVKDLYDRVIDSDKYDELLYSGEGWQKNEKKLNSLVKKAVNKRYKTEVPMEYQDDQDPYVVLINDIMDEVKYDFAGCAYLTSSASFSLIPSPRRSLATILPSGEIRKLVGMLRIPYSSTIGALLPSVTAITLGHVISSFTRNSFQLSASLSSDTP